MDTVQDGIEHLRPVPAGPRPVVAPPVTRPPAPVAPKVESYTETSSVCKSGETFETISQHYFGTPALAEALRLYNRNHPRTSERMHREGTLTAGETIFIPQQDILEQRYGSSIPKPKLNTTIAPPPAGSSPAPFIAPPLPASVVPSRNPPGGGNP